LLQKSCQERSGVNLAPTMSAGAFRYLETRLTGDFPSYTLKNALQREFQSVLNSFGDHSGCSLAQRSTISVGSFTSAGGRSHHFSFRAKTTKSSRTRWSGRTTVSGGNLGRGELDVRKKDRSAECLVSKHSSDLFPFHYFE
jgi:hypothetical protein